MNSDKPEYYECADWRPDLAPEPSVVPQPVSTPKFQPEKKCCSVCDVKKVCHVCGAQTLFACSDCRIDLATTVYVCAQTDCRDTHERYCPEVLRAHIREYERAAGEPQPVSTVKRVRVPRSVCGDWPIGHTTVVEPGIYEAHVNPQGAVSVRAADGSLLGLKPGEFEWD